MMQIAVSLSVFLSFLVSEFLGLASGGLVSAGYLSLYFSYPLRLISTFALALLIYAIVTILDNFIFIYGKRRFMACVLLSIAGTYLVEKLLVSVIPVASDLRIIGYIIPGLMANDMLKQGILKTIAAVIIISCLIWLVTINGFVR